MIFVGVILDSQQNWMDSKEISYVTFTLTHAQPPQLSNVPDGTFVTTNESTGTHHCHLKPIVDISIHSWCGTFWGFGQMCKNMYPSLKYTV